jgi:peroxiredoxin
MPVKKFVLAGVLALISVLIMGACLSSPGGVNKVENFTLKDYNGKDHSLDDYKDAKAILVLFIATECPVSNAYNSRMEKLFNDYKDKGIVVLGINSNKEENVDRIREHAEENSLSFTILKDEKNVIADKFDASVTPEAYVLNNNFDVLYHGRIDNSRNESEIASQDLRNALDEILSGKEVSKTETKAFGCTIKRV